MPGQRKKWKGLSFTDKLNILYKWVTGALFALVIVALIGLAVIFGIRSASDAISTDHKCAPLHHPAGEPTVKLCERRGSLENPNSLVLRTTEFINGLVLVVILLEIAESVFTQILRASRLSTELVRDFLVIGVVSSVRHLLASGARVSLGPQQADTHSLQELGVGATVILVLAASYVLVQRLGFSHDADELGHYAKLRDEGTLTQDEFDAQKVRLLGTQS